MIAKTILISVMIATILIFVMILRTILFILNNNQNYFTFCNDIKNYFNFCNVIKNYLKYIHTSSVIRYNNHVFSIIACNCILDTGSNINANILSNCNDFIYEILTSLQKLNQYSALPLSNQCVIKNIKYILLLSI